MIRVISTDGIGKPRRWLLCFKRRSDSRIVSLLAAGRYKHVLAFGYVEEFDAWLFFDLRFRHLDIQIARGAAARRLMAGYIDGATLLGIPARDTGSLALGFWCVPAIAKLIGLNSGALRPDALFRDCLAQGGEIVADEHQPAIPAARSHAESAAATGAG
jgi:hypothetical protein